MHTERISGMAQPGRPAALTYENAMSPGDNVMGVRDNVGT